MTSVPTHCCAGRPRPVRATRPACGPSPLTAVLLGTLALLLEAGATSPAGAQLVNEETANPVEPAWRRAARTETLLLSGTGPADAVPWQFEIDAGRRAGEAGELPVPSHWQQHGYGSYFYGHQEEEAESGTYRTRFRVPGEWAGRRVELVFGGVMTDTTVRIDGESAGPTHRGGFTEFRYDVTRLVRPGATQQLEVVVDARSSADDVQAAEREADYWIFGGIYRPVWLEAAPAENVRILAVDARGDGTLRVDVECTAQGPRQVHADVLTRPGAGSRFAPWPIGSLFGSCGPGERVALRGRIGGARPWSAEEPHLYDLEVALRRRMDPDASPPGITNRVLHLTQRTIGFRTVEVRSDGLFVNGRRTVLKGVNRHSFWPESGRAIDPGRNVEDVRLLRELNFNAVRTAHSPPDPAFLDACDELGLYVLAELPGWHDPYGRGNGRRIAREMLRRDQHHPSIVLWANGNEGGWNRSVDGVFAELDIQRRPVLHPWSTFGGFATQHYPSWRELERLLDDTRLEHRLARARFGELPLVMPTEMLHALYDGGGAAGLDRFLRRLETSERFAGLFLWSLFDEGVVRTDRDPARDAGGLPEVDTFGNHAADGILDAWRRPEASAAGVRELLSPVVVAGAVSSPRADRPQTLLLRLHNRFEQIDLQRSELALEWLRLPAPLSPDPRIEVLAAERVAAPQALPGEHATLRLTAPGDLDAAIDALRVAVARRDRPGEGVVSETVLGLRPRRAAMPPRAAAGDAPSVETDEQGGVTVRVGDLALELDSHGSLLGLRRGGRDSGLRGAIPIGVGRDRNDTAAPSAAAPAQPRTGRLGSASEPSPDRGVTVRFRDTRGLVRSWWVRPDGWIRVHAFTPLTSAAATPPPDGLLFELDALCDASPRWLGRGPHRVWGNRRTGALGVWARQSTLCAESWDPRDSAAGLYEATWMRLALPQGELLVMPGGEELIGLGAPRFPDDARQARADLPGGLTIHRRAPEIGTKFHSANELAPPASATTVHLSAWLHFEPHRTPDDATGGEAGRSGGPPDGR